MTRPDPLAPMPSVRIPVIEESLAVGIRTEVTGALRVRIEADEAVEHADLHTTQDDVDVERVHRDQPVEAPRAPWMEGDVLVVPVYAERLVLQRQLVLTQELRIVRRQQTQTVSTPVRLRRERAVVERRQADGEWIEVTVPPAGDDARQGGAGQAVPAVIAAKETP